MLDVRTLSLLLQGAGVSLLLALGSIACATLLVLALLVFYALPALDLKTGPYVAGLLVLTLYVGALFAEVFRGGVLAIPRPQWESAKSLGLPPAAMLSKVIAPLVV